MESILFNKVPRWYELGWDQKKKAIILRVHKEYIDSLLSGIKANTFAWEKFWPIKTLSTTFCLKEFSDDLDKNFGFYSMFKNKGEQGEYVVQEVAIPVIVTLGKKKCNSCGGTGKDEAFEADKCKWCNGTGREEIWDRKMARAISANFTMMFLLLDFLEIKTSSNKFQLMTLTTNTIKDDCYGSPIGGAISSQLKEWLAKSYKEEFPEVIKAAMTVEQKMLGKRHTSKDYYYNFRVIENGKIDLVVPGDACDLYVDGFVRTEPGLGYELSCHNTDTPYQQMSLLAGMAALHQKAQKEIDKGA